MFSPEFEAKYKILEIIGEGGMGRVYLAEETALQRKVAIKFLTATAESDALAVDRFVQEARICAALKHPNVVPMYVSGTESGLPYMVFEFVEGHDLAHALYEGPLATAEALRIARGVLSGLECAHDAGIIHRDLKPQNILLRRSDRQPMVADFGMAKREDNSEVRTKRGLIVGTPLYMAPEQIRGQTLTHAVDLYAVGCTLYEMIAGQPPFVSENEVQILEMHLNRPPPRARDRVPALPEDVDVLLGVALDKKPELRFASAREFGEAVDALLDGRPLPPRARSSLPSRPGAISRAAQTRVGSRPDIRSGVGQRSTARTNSLSGASRPDGARSGISRVPSLSTGGRGSRADLVPAAQGPSTLARLSLGGAIFAIGLLLAWLFLPGVTPVARDVRVILESDGTALAEWSVSPDAPGLLQCSPEDGGPTVRAPALRAASGRLEARATGLTVGRAYRVELKSGKAAIWSASGIAPQPEPVNVRYPTPDSAELDLPKTAPEAARLTRSSAQPVPEVERKGALLAFKVAPGDAYEDLALEWTVGPGLSVRARLPPVKGLAHRLTEALEKHDPRPLLTKLVTRRDYRVEAEDDGEAPVRPMDWFGNKIEPKAAVKKPPYIGVVREVLSAEPFLKDLEAFRPLAAEFFAGPPGQDAIRTRLYEGLLNAEYYDLVIRSQRDTPELGVRDLYRGLVDLKHRPAPDRPDPRDSVLFGHPLGYGTADRAQWDVMVFWWRRFGSDALIPGIDVMTEEKARSAVRPERIESWDGVPDERRGDTVVLSLTQLGLRPIYFYDVTFRSASGDPDAGRPFRVHFSYPPDGTGYMAYLKREGGHPGPREGRGRRDSEDFNWTELSARFPARLLPRGKLAVRVGYEHLPGPTLRQLGVWHRTSFTREVGLRLQAASPAPEAARPDPLPSRTP